MEKVSRSALVCSEMGISWNRCTRASDLLNCDNISSEVASDFNCYTLYDELVIGAD